MSQSEQQLEQQLIENLKTGGFEYVVLPDSKSLEQNLKKQLEIFNETTFSEPEFEKIYNHLLKGDRFYKAKSLRDRFNLKRDNETTFSMRFFNTEQWCRNEYQVAQQISQEGRYANRYDVTLLINGLPLVQIELKRRGLEMKEAFNQIQRYHKHSYSNSLFEYIQIFVISNGVNTKYFSNNPKQNFEQTFYWTDKENKKITNLNEFTNVFLEKCFLSEIIAEHIVLAEAKQAPMILRPYQYYAVKAIEERVKNSNKNGYIWHTTGSGKTLTSYKTSQILSRMPEIEKVLFVVDRKDLDIQTTKEFNSFSDGSVDGTNYTRSLVTQLQDQKRKLIVTTIQKLELAVSKNRFSKELEYLKDKKVVIIFDECHRGHFGKTHTKIKNFFAQSQLFGFTGTPIFAENNIQKSTTKDIFGDCLHKYIITNAISDNNVLGFAVEYVGKYTKKDSDIISNEQIETDILVDDINSREVLESDMRIGKISEYILSDWNRKTKDGKFNAIFAVSSVDVLKKYYKKLKELKSDDFKIATIFTYQANEDESPDVLDGDIFLDEEDSINQHSRDFLEDCIKDYNQEFNTNFSTNIFYDYYRDVQKRVKNKEIDLILVVNMFLTGFDSPFLNTLYVDKNLKYHGLIQAYSRTNRLLSSDKPHGNIVSFRNLKEATDKALALFGDENAKEVVFKKPYETQKIDFEEKLKSLKEKVPTIDSVDDLRGEEEKADFIKDFRDLLRIKSSLETYAEFNFNDLGISEQEFYDYQSKYLDIYQERKTDERYRESILDEIDFEIELTLKDIINFDYIIQLIAGLRDITSDDVRKKKTDDILKIFDRDIQLRKKKDLIKKFIEDHLPNIPQNSSVENYFDGFWNTERFKMIHNLANEENISDEKLKQLVGEYLYTKKLPTSDEIIDSMEKAPKFLQRRSVVNRIKETMKNIVEVFEW